MEEQILFRITSYKIKERHELSIHHLKHYFKVNRKINSFEHSFTLLFLLLSCLFLATILFNELLVMIYLSCVLVII